MSYAPSQRWDIERFTPGGPGGAAFVSELDRLKRALEAMVSRTDALPPLDRAPEAWCTAILDLEHLSDQLQQASAAAGCAHASETTSDEAERADVITRDLGGRFDRAWVPVAAALCEADGAAFEALLADERLADVGPRLRHVRAGARLRLARPLQELMTELDREALHGWGALYDSLSGRLEATVALPGETAKPMGIAAVNGLRSHPDEAVRRIAFDASRTAWSAVAPVCAMALTNLTGARQTRYDRAGVDELATSLHDNRVDRETLTAMWAAADAARPALVRYLRRKARLLGKERLDWWDQVAPLPGSDEALDWAGAQRLVVDAFGEYDGALRDFAVRALKERWIEAEQREGKQQGGFCTALPLSRESRIFLTFSGTLDSTLTLAHELGHAWHNEVLFDVPSSRRDVTSSLAETASTFAEAIVRDRALAHAAPETRLSVLDQQLQAGVSFLMNIPARYTFERELFALRREGPLDPETLSARMVAAQRAAYGDALGSWDDLFWASKLHYYISSFGFYNWPYAFGYLFSGAVYQRAIEEGAAFVPTYRELLLRTGHEPSEKIARDVLGEDLTSPAFWTRSIQPLLGQVDEFLAASEA